MFIKTELEHSLQVCRLCVYASESLMIYLFFPTNGNLNYLLT